MIALKIPLMTDIQKIVEAVERAKPGMEKYYSNEYSRKFPGLQNVGSAVVVLPPE